MDIIKALLNTPKDKIRIIEADSKDRKLLHMWLSNKHSSKHAVGLKSKLFESEYEVYIQCYHCDYKNVRMKNYHYGVLSNNQDEWRSGICPRCEESINYECNYDDDAIYVSKRNIMAFGDYFKNYQKYPGDEVSDDIIFDVLSKKKIYEIDIPPFLLSRKKIEKYIDANLVVTNII